MILRTVSTDLARASSSYIRPSTRPQAFIGSLPLIVPARRWAHVPPPVTLTTTSTGKPAKKAEGIPTFTRGQDGDGSIAPLLLAFGVGFTSVFTLFYLFSNDRASTRLLPNKYNTFGILETRRCTSPSQPRGQQGDGAHVLLTIDSPDLIAPPRLTPAQTLATVNGKPFWRILSVHVKEPSLQIERPYTPLYADALAGPRGSRPIELLVKRYPDGELGRYAHRLQAWEPVEMRGPEVTWQDEQVDNVVLLVGGTGITPAYQLITSIFGRPDRPMPTGRIPRISLLYAAPQADSLLLLPELVKLREAYGKWLNVDLFVDQDDAAKKRNWLSWLTGQRKVTLEREGMPVHIGRMDQEKITETLQRHTRGSKRVLVCGPDGMVAAVAGAKDGQAQGALGGILAQVGCAPEDVHKL